MKRTFLLLLFLSTYATGSAQNYHAVHGSFYEASLNVNNNPASILNTPLPWDITIFGTQLKTVTNAITIHNYSLLSSPAKSKYELNQGDFGRKGEINLNTNLLNARFALSRTRAFAFGINLRGYAKASTLPFNYVDTLAHLDEFLFINQNTPKLEGDLINSGWIEIFGAYSQTIMDDEVGRLNAGFTLKANRGISGAFAEVRNVGIVPSSQPGDPGYRLMNGSVTYGYSANYDSWDAESPSREKLNNFLKRTEGGFSMDLGLEYLVKTQAVTTFSDEDDGYYEYEWKFGLSLLDLGFVQYKYGVESRRASDPRGNLTADDLENKFTFIQDLASMNDSLATIVNSFNTLQGRFKVLHPMRMVLNADKYIRNHVYLNGELSLNLSSLAGDKKKHVRELSLLTITPRWETRRLGAFLPLQYNAAGRFWIGAAFKAGPLLLGFHNLANVFANNKMQNGGGYLAIILRPGNTTRAERYNKVDCPPLLR